MVARAPPAGTTRTRFKKVTYKQRLCLHKGSSLIDGAALGHDSVEVDGAPEHENDLGVELHEREVRTLICLHHPPSICIGTLRANWRWQLARSYRIHHSRNPPPP